MHGGIQAIRAENSVLELYSFALAPNARVLKRTQKRALKFRGAIRMGTGAAGESCEQQGPKCTLYGRAGNERPPIGRAYGEAKPIRRDLPSDAVQREAVRVEPTRFNELADGPCVQDPFGETLATRKFRKPFGIEYMRDIPIRIKVNVTRQVPPGADMDRCETLKFENSGSRTTHCFSPLVEMGMVTARPARYTGW